MRISCCSDLLGLFEYTTLGGQWILSAVVLYRNGISCSNTTLHAMAVMIAVIFTGGRVHIFSSRKTLKSNLPNTFSKRRFYDNSSLTG